MRRQFTLPEEDEEFLTTLSNSWETINELNHNWLIIYDIDIPEGYNVEKTNVALRIDRGYPVAQIDMAYFQPHLSLNNGKAIAATQARQNIIEKEWQRWSRHRTGINPWRPGVDNVSTHLESVKNWIDREL